LTRQQKEFREAQKEDEKEFREELKEDQAQISDLQNKAKNLTRHRILSQRVCWKQNG
jgi:hypothetical protein